MTAIPDLCIHNKYFSEQCSECCIHIFNWHEDSTKRWEECRLCNMKKKTIKETTGGIISSILMYIGIWCFTKIYSKVDVYSPNEDVEGVTFTNDEGYLKHVGKYEKTNTT